MLSEIIRNKILIKVYATKDENKIIFLYIEVIAGPELADTEHSSMFLKLLSTKETPWLF